MVASSQPGNCIGYVGRWANNRLRRHFPLLLGLSAPHLQATCVCMRLTSRHFLPVFPYWLLLRVVMLFRCVSEYTSPKNEHTTIPKPVTDKTIRAAWSLALAGRKPVILFTDTGLTIHRFPWGASSGLIWSITPSPLRNPKVICTYCNTCLLHCSLYSIGRLDGGRLTSQNCGLAGLLLILGWSPGVDHGMMVSTGANA
jgi:hypothetical protein